MVNPYPLMFSHQYCDGDTVPKEPELEECYQGPSYQYFSREEYFYEDSNFHRNPFEEESDPFSDYQEDFTPIRRSRSHEVLGVDEDSDEEDIKRAFRKKALLHHPDKGGDPKQFIKIREAYEDLIQ
tara:strand:- start:2327 stop:2704 length:378 start_codon:yes stop_codon:yes gene_type:complete